MELLIEDNLILAAAKLNPSDAQLILMDKMILSVSNWEYFTVNALRNGLGPLIYKNFTFLKNYSSIPLETISELKQSYYISCDRNKVFYTHFHNVINALSEAGISAIALKGIFLAEEIYGDIGLRPMSDIDLLVRKENINKCLEKLSEIAYVSHERFKSKFIRKYHDSKHLPPMISGNVSVEIHQKVHADDCEYNVNVEDYWKNAKRADGGNTKFLTLSSGDLLQFLCLHLDHHFVSGKIQFYLFCDIAEILKFYRNNFNWESFQQSCEKYNCSKNVFRQLFLANKYFDAPLPDYILQKASEHYEQQIENLFILYLKGENKKISKEILHSTLKNLKKVNGTRNKLLYLIHDIFPSVSYMKKRYQVKNSLFVFWYYLIRLKKGTGVFFSSLMRSK